MKERQYKYRARLASFDGYEDDYRKLKEWAEEYGESFWTNAPLAPKAHTEFTFCAIPNDLLHAKKDLSMGFHALSFLVVDVDIEGIPVQKEMD